MSGGVAPDIRRNTPDFRSRTPDAASLLPDLSGCPACFGQAWRPARQLTATCAASLSCVLRLAAPQPIPRVRGGTTSGKMLLESREWSSNLGPWSSDLAPRPTTPESRINIGTGGEPQGLPGPPSCRMGTIREPGGPTLVRAVHWREARRGWPLLCMHWSCAARQFGQ